MPASTSMRILYTNSTPLLLYVQNTNEYGNLVTVVYNLTRPLVFPDEYIELNNIHLDGDINEILENLPLCPGQNIYDISTRARYVYMTFDELLEKEINKNVVKLVSVKT